MLNRMWENLMSLGAMIITKPKRKTESFAHVCPYCGAGMSRLHLYQGGIVGRGPNAAVRAAIKCLKCGRQHRLKGATPFERGVVLVLLKAPRKRPGEKKLMYWEGAA